MPRHCLVMLAVLLTAGPSAAASWADGLFDSLTRDFGSVPRGVVLTHPFRLTNNTGQHLTISGVRVSCGCTTARALQTELEPGQSTVILAEMDTRRFQRDKNVTIYVQFSRPRVEEVRLWVQANSRDDVIVTPDTLAFGPVKKGTSPSAGVSVSFMGDNQWRITGVASESNYVQPALHQLPGNTLEVNYRVTARLRPDTPVGKWYTDLWLLTNNPATPRVRVPLTVEVQSVLSLSPPALALGTVRAGTLTERKILVRGSKSFRILAVQGQDAQWAVRESAGTGKPVHVLTISFRARQAGDVTRNLRIITDLIEDGVIDFPVRARVVR